MQRWKDRQLVWNPVDYANISHLFIPSRIIWTPSIDIFYRLTLNPGHCRHNIQDIGDFFLLAKRKAPP